MTNLPLWRQSYVIDQHHSSDSTKIELSYDAQGALPRFCTTCTHMIGPACAMVRGGHRCICGWPHRTDVGVPDPLDINLNWHWVVALEETGSSQMPRCLDISYFEGQQLSHTKYRRKQHPNEIYPTNTRTTLDVCASEESVGSRNELLKHTRRR